MPVNQHNTFGEISISEAVLKDITLKTVETFLKAEKIYTDKVKRDLPKNVRITADENGSVSIGLKITGKYGENLIDFTKKLQILVKEEVEKMSEINVATIDITIEELEYPESDDTEEHELEEAQEEHNGDNGEEQANKQ